MIEKTYLSQLRLLYIYIYTYKYVYIYIQLFSLVAQKVKTACNVGDLSLIPGSGRSPEEGNSNPLQYSCLDISMDTRAWWATYSP